MGSHNTQPAIDGTWWMPADLALLYHYMLSRRDPREFVVALQQQYDETYLITILRKNANHDAVPHNILALEPQ